MTFVAAVVNAIVVVVVVVVVVAGGLAIELGLLGVWLAKNFPQR